jgi:hypothetical protein
VLVAIVAVSLLAADWATRTVDALHHGMTTVDTLWYHMPFAARFVQQGNIWPIHYVDADSVTAFFPASSELFHALGIIFMGSDVLSPFINLGWAALALLAAWCIGRRFHLAPVTLTGVAALLATPGLVATQPGGAYDDVVGLALLLSCAALLITSAADGRAHLNGLAVAALAAGVAVGTKYTFIAPVIALTIGITVLARRGRRRAELGLWVLLVVITGGFWYLRNLIAVGNPLPSLKLKFGPLGLPSPASSTPRSTVAHFLLNGTAWGQNFVPGLRLSFGPAWWALLPLAVAGLILGIATGPDRVGRMLGWVGLAAAAAFTVTPQYLTVFGAPVYFVDNVRYVDPALVFGLVLLPIVPALRRGRRPLWLLGAYGAILVVTQTDGTIWPISWFGGRFAAPIRGVDSLTGLLIGAVVLGVGVSSHRWLQRHPHWRPPVPVVLVLVVALVGLGFSLQQSYLRNRYTSSDPSNFGSWAQHVDDSRIAMAGGLTQLQYGYYGRDLTNYVQYVAQAGPNGGYSPITNCKGWRNAINSGRYDYVVTSTDAAAHRNDVFARPSSYTLWTGSDPASVLIRRAIIPVAGNGGNGNGGSTVFVGFSLFRVTGELDPSSCGPST